MSKFKYSLDVGDYIGPVRIDINLDVQDGLSAEDYTAVRDALKVVEDIGRRYEQEAIQRKLGAEQHTASGNSDNEAIKTTSKPPEELQ